MSRARTALVAVFLALLAVALAPAALLAPEGTIALPGLRRPARVVTDRYGIPHIQAETLADLYYVWGFVTARDRLWQLEHNRRAARGQLWRWLGNRALRSDGGAQLFELARHARRGWERERHDPEVGLPLERFAAGVNAWIGLCRAGCQPWPEEFEHLGRYPGDWHASDAYLLVLGQGVVLDLVFPELEEAERIDSLGLDTEIARRRFERQWIYRTIPDRPAPPGPAPGGRRGRIGMAPGMRVADLAARARSGHAGWPFDNELGAEGRASNVFAVAAARSASGVPLLANDPHLALSSPGAFHVVHVTVPGVVDAIGACVTGLPAIVSGRNATCAWGVTALAADVVDVYLDTLSTDGRKVRSGRRWRDIRQAPYNLGFEKFGFTIPAFGQTRRYTPHGPVLAFDRRRRIALSARWSALDDTVRIGRMIGIERSGSAAEVCQRFRTLSTPSLNVVAVDQGGAVRYQPVGTIPERGFMPPPGLLSGDGRHEWKGVLRSGELPSWQAPASGFVVNANNLPAGESFPEPWPRYDWAHDRALRIVSRLAGDREITIQDMKSVQNDVYSRQAERLLPLLISHIDSLGPKLTARARAAVDTLRRWDLYARRPGVAPTLFRSWVGALQGRFGLQGLNGLTLAALDGRAPEALPSARAATAVARALEDALLDLDRLLGPDPGKWRWWRAHRARFRHPLGELGEATSPTIGVDGDNGTVCVGASSLPGSPRVTHGPVYRHVVDLATPTVSYGVVPPGNSGDHRSIHARDHLTRWANHGYVPFYMAWADIERVQQSEVKLVPSR